MAREKPKSAMASLLDSLGGESDILVEDKMEEVVQKPSIYSSYGLPEQEKMTSQDHSSYIIEIDPSECILWKFADRPEDELGDIEALAESLLKFGQQEPILVRKTSSTQREKYEVIFGNRRWRAAKVAGIKLHAICKALTDQQAALCQKVENENRKDLSDYARAISYHGQISNGVFKNESELCRFLCLSKQRLNDIMSYLRIPKELKDSIDNFKDISSKLATKLATMSKDPKKLEVLINLGPKISSKLVNSNNLEKYIEKQTYEKDSKEVSKVIYRKNKDGTIMFVVKHMDNGDISIKIKKPVSHMFNIETMEELFSGQNNK